MVTITVATKKNNENRQLTSLAILNERSAVPAVVGMKRKPAPVSKAEKERLLRTAGRTKRGPLGSHVDGSEMGKGSALMELSEAVKESGKYDVWGNSVVDADMTEEEEPPETIKPKPVKVRRELMAFWMYANRGAGPQALYP